MKIAILTYSHENNCGAFLQTWALKTVFEKYGDIVELPFVKAYRNKGRLYIILQAVRNGLVNFLRTTIYQCLTLGIKEWVNWNFNRYRKKKIVIKKVALSELLEYDMIVVGSDQVWNPDMGIYKLPLYLGEIIPKSIPLVGYAVSVGDATPAFKYNERFADAVKRFKRVYAREKLTSDYLKHVSGMECPQVLDPTLLLPIENYKSLEEGTVPREKYVFFYVVGTNEVSKLVPEMLDYLGINCAVFSDGSIDFVPHKKPKGYRRFISPGEFVRLVRNASAIVACSFHGTAFAVLSGKPFISLTTKSMHEKYNTRAGDLLCRLGAPERMFSVKESVGRMCEVLCSPVKESVFSHLDALRNVSYTAIEYLQNITRHNKS